MQTLVDRFHNQYAGHLILNKSQPMGWQESKAKTTKVVVPRQTDIVSCGVHVLENARFFFREGPESLDDPLEIWHTSSVYDGLRARHALGEADSGEPTLDQYQDDMRKHWINLARTELGHRKRGGIRYPEHPLGDYDRRSAMWDQPNLLWDPLTPYTIGNIEFYDRSMDDMVAMTQEFKRLGISTE